MRMPISLASSVQARGPSTATRFPRCGTSAGSSKCRSRREVGTERPGLGPKLERGVQWRREDGLPVPLWDGRTGAISRSVAEAWRSTISSSKWNGTGRLGPKLAGESQHLGGRLRRLFLNAAVRPSRFDGPANEPEVRGADSNRGAWGHDTGGWTRKEMLDAMAARMMSRETVRPG